MRSSVIKVVAAAVLLAGTLSAPATAAPGGGLPTARISIGPYVPHVSPDGDGFRDRLRIPFTISRRGNVIATLRNLSTGRTVFSRRILALDHTTVLERGRHTIGLGDLGGERLRAGTYRLVMETNGAQAEPSQTARASFTLRPAAIWISRHTLGESGRGTVVSPNGDGAIERTRIEFGLERRSRVTAVVPAPNGAGTRTIRLGVLRPGRHYWLWDGRYAGRAVPDGQQVVSLRARPLVLHPRALAEADVPVLVDTVAPDPTVTLNRTTVYPAATVIHDSLRVGVAAASGELVVAEVRTAGGGWITSLPPAEHSCGWQPYSESDDEARSCALATWDARTSAGPVATGAYVLAVTVTDRGGNQTRVQRPISVSSAQLVEQTGSVTWPASTAPGDSHECDPMGSMGCYDYRPCGIGPSDRFPGGVSFRSDTEGCAGQFAYTSVPYGASPEPPAGTTPYDRFRVLATGGPTSPGDDDTGWLSASGTPRPSRVSLAGDGTGATAWLGVDPDVELFPFGARRMRWQGGADEPNRYDVASYTLEYTYYVPAA